MVADEEIPPKCFIMKDVALPTHGSSSSTAKMLLETHIGVAATSSLWTEQDLH